MGLDTQVWNLQDQTLQCELKGHKSKISSLVLVNSDRILVSASADEDLLCSWDIKSGVLLHAIQIRYLGHVVGSPRHSLVIPLSGLWDLKTVVYDAEQAHAFQVPIYTRAASFTPDGYSLVTATGGYEDASLKIWNLGSLSTDQKLAPKPSDPTDPPNLNAKSLYTQHVCARANFRNQKPDALADSDRFPIHISGRSGHSLHIPVLRRDFLRPRDWATVNQNWR